jgi:hypothetical protein
MATGAPYAAGVPVPVTLSSTSPRGVFAPSAAGPWSSTLTLPIANGATSVSAVYRDTAAGTPTLTAAAAGKVPASLPVAVAAGPLARLAVSPPSTTLAPGASQAFTAAGTDAYGNAVPLAGVTWTTSAPGTLSTTTGTATTFSAGTTGGAGTVTATAEGISGTASVTVSGGARVAAVTYTRISSGFRMTLRLVDGAGRAIPGATVGYRITRNGGTYLTRTATTAGDGTVSLSTSVPGGCYSTTVTSVSVAGWDGRTPANSFCK